MRCTIPEISWHNRDPVLSIDIQGGVYKDNKGDPFWRLATGGADSHVLIWHLIVNEAGGATVKCIADLDRHQKAVNVVRFSPSKEVLASGDDESTIILWRQKEDCEFFIHSEENENKEQWISWKVLRGHIEDVYDISWSPDSNSLVSGSVDNTAILWDVHKAQSTGIIRDHKGFVQGVSWDPCNQFICTVGTDRHCRLIDINTKRTVQRVYKSKIPTPVGHPLEGKIVRLFHDDTFKSFFRRLTFSLDGNLIIVPSGMIEPIQNTERISNATIVFSRQSLKEPIMILPSLNESTIAVRCCPIYFQLRKITSHAMITLPYRIIFAVATQSSVLIYDTQQKSPIAAISNIHYTRLTDVSWSSDGQILIVSSTDGYCSIIHFQPGELGEEYKPENNTPTKVDTKVVKKPKAKSTADIDDSAMDIILTPENNKTECFKFKQLEEQNKKEELDEMNIENNEKQHESFEDETEDIKLVFSEDSDDPEHNTKTVVKKTPPKTDIPSALNLTKTPRRVELITLSSPKGPKKG